MRERILSSNGFPSSTVNTGMVLLDSKSAHREEQSENSRYGPKTVGGEKVPHKNEIVSSKKKLFSVVEVSKMAHLPLYCHTQATVLSPQDRFMCQKNQATQPYNFFPTKLRNEHTRAKKHTPPKIEFWTNIQTSDSFHFLRKSDIPSIQLRRSGKNQVNFKMTRK